MRPLWRPPVALGGDKAFIWSFLQCLLFPVFPVPYSHPRISGRLGLLVSLLTWDTLFLFLEMTASLSCHCGSSNSILCISVELHHFFRAIFWIPDWFTSPYLCPMQLEIVCFLVMCWCESVGCVETVSQGRSWSLQGVDWSVFAHHVETQCSEKAEWLSKYINE